MPRPATGQVVVRDGAAGRTFALRFRAYGERRYQTLGTDAEGWDDRRAATELENVLADVRRGLWRPTSAAPVAPEVKAEPTFNEFALGWYERKAPELRDRSAEDYRWALNRHLLPHFANYRLSEITVEVVDRYRAAKVREREDRLVDRALSNSTIDKTLVRLSQILEEAVEYGYIARNPARGRRRRLKPDTKAGAWLEPDQVEPLLAECGRNRALVATLIRAGLRVGEAIELRNRDLDLANGRIHVRASKTGAGVRSVDMSPALRDDLVAHRRSAPMLGQSAYVFTTSRGTPQTRQNVRRRVLLPAVRRANAKLAERNEPLISERLSPHSLRHTFTSLLLETGAPVPYVMAQLGHADPKTTLSIYAHVLQRRGGRETGQRMDELTRPLSRVEELPYRGTSLR